MTEYGSQPEIGIEFPMNQNCDSMKHIDNIEHPVNFGGKTPIKNIQISPKKKG